jgi:hypothetical protein
MEVSVFTEISGCQMLSGMKRRDTVHFDFGIIYIYIFFFWLMLETELLLNWYHRQFGLREVNLEF